MADAAYEPRLKTEYRSRIRAQLKERFGYTNEMQIPKIDKIVINMGVGEAVADSKKINSAMADLARIAGQKPVPTKARLSIASFKLREGMTVGCKVTLRQDRMYEFLDRLITIALPRVRAGPGGAPGSSPWPPLSAAPWQNVQPPISTRYAPGSCGGAGGGARARGARSRVPRRLLRSDRAPSSRARPSASRARSAG